MSIVYEIGLRADHFKAAAQLYDEAFGEKFKVPIRSKVDRMTLLERTFVSKFAVTAIAGTDLVGLAGFHIGEGSLTGGIGVRRLFEELGLVRGLWAAAVLSLYERTPMTGQLVMDGIAVHQDYRGRGIGSRLLSGVVNHARERGFNTVRLGVCRILRLRGDF